MRAAEEDDDDFLASQIELCGILVLRRSLIPFDDWEAVLDITSNGISGYDVLFKRHVREIRMVQFKFSPSPLFSVREGEKYEFNSWKRRCRM